MMPGARRSGGRPNERWPNEQSSDEDGTLIAAGSSLPLFLRLAVRELRGGLAGFRIFLACLALGVAAIAAVGSRPPVSSSPARWSATTTACFCRPGAMSLPMPSS
jgi:hypothetical protein